MKCEFLVVLSLLVTLGGLPWPGFRTNHLN